jgi:hypothetical protein
MAVSQFEENLNRVIVSVYKKGDREQCDNYIGN